MGSQMRQGVIFQFDEMGMEFSKLLIQEAINGAGLSLLPDFFYA
jgi:hypothetical protein